LSGDKQQAEDLTQDVFLKALRAFEDYDPSISQVSWILTIARNHLINYLEKNRQHICLEEVENVLPDCLDVFERMNLKHDENRLLEALKSLPVEDALIVRLKYLEGWPYDDIAVKTGKTCGCLRVQAYRALKTLRRILKQK